MRRVMLLVVAFVCASASSLAAHDMYLKLDSFFVFAGDTMTIPLLNGTFTKSENAVTRDRVRDLSLVSPRGTTQPLPVAWRDKGDTTVFCLTTKDEGTYVVGLSTLPRSST